MVRKPTREDHLLDLVLTDVPTNTKCKVHPKIADHSVVTARVSMQAPTRTPITRVVWDFAKADWKALRSAFQNANWEEIISHEVDEAADNLTNHILDTARRFIPMRAITEHKSSHPWLDDECRKAVRRKGEAEGTDSYTSECQRCSETISRSYQRYIAKIRVKIQELPKNSKQWWRLNRILLRDAPTNTGVAAFKNEEKQWVFDAKAKADLFAKTFVSKFGLPDCVSDPMVEEPTAGAMGSNFVLIRTRWTQKVLNTIDANKATGPDRLPAVILKSCAEELAAPITKLIRLILGSGTWPTIWKNHWMVPVFKKGSVFDPSKYRGIHLTAVLSKAVERVLGKIITDHFEATGAYGDSQFAFRRGRSCRDLVTILVCNWVLAFDG